MTKNSENSPNNKLTAKIAHDLADTAKDVAHETAHVAQDVANIAHDLADTSEAVLEKSVFKHRILLMILILLGTLWCGYQASQVTIDIAFEKLIPQTHEYIVNGKKLLRDYKGDSVDSVRVSVAVKKGDIFTADYMEKLKQISDELFYLKGVDRGNIQSLWTSNTRWQALTSEGYEGGSVIPSSYDGSKNSLSQIKTNVLRSIHVGSLIANDFKSTIIKVPLNTSQEADERFDYQAFSHALEKQIRDKFNGENMEIHIVGFPKWIADLVDGFSSISLFFAVSVIITIILLYLYTRCIKSTLVPVLCSIVAVVWQLGLLHKLGFGLDPYTVLVPFLVFAIGISHGVQIINAFANKVSEGKTNLNAAKLTFRGLYVAGMVALISDAFGFMTLLLIEIDVIRELAISASIGVAIIIITNLLLLPILMSYAGVSQAAVNRIDAKRDQRSKLWELMASLITPKAAMISVAIAAMGFLFGIQQSIDLKIGDLESGQPMLRQDSRYNLDNEFVTSNYSTSSDQLVVFVSTAVDRCTEFPVITDMNRLQWELQNTQGVQSTKSAVDTAKLMRWGTNEGNFKWLEPTRDQYNLTRQIGLTGINKDCSVAFILVYLTDHKAETLTRVTGVVKAFNDTHGSEQVQFLLGMGNAGIAAATNQVIERSQHPMLLLVYAVVALLCFIAYRSIRAVICIIVPLALTSVLCQALMAHLGIGVKVATLPVIALGVGIGVDYGIYIFNRLDEYMKLYPLQQAYLMTLKSTGKAVLFTGLTLAIGVGTWIWSPIKFQADMGILLTFMFLWNMVGAMWLLPALACLLYRKDEIASERDFSLDSTK